MGTAAILFACLAMAGLAFSIDTDDGDDPADPPLSL